jgi:aconitate hydratase 2/2-methylisocitrate dehydratase
VLGRLPQPAEYFDLYREKIEPNKEKIYRYLQFDEMPDYR